MNWRKTLKPAIPVCIALGLCLNLTAADDKSDVKEYDKKVKACNAQIDKILSKLQDLQAGTVEYQTQLDRLYGTKDKLKSFTAELDKLKNSK